MPMAAGPASSNDRVAPPAIPVQFPAMAMHDSFVKDSIIAWYKGEFAAANAIIDELCTHLRKVSAANANGTDGQTSSEYDSVFAAIHGRRLNWIPVLEMQKYHSIADVAIELHKMTTRKLEQIKDQREIEKSTQVKVEFFNCPPGDEIDQVNGGVELEEDSPESDITDSGSQEVQPTSDQNIDICSNHEDCNSPPSQMKMLKGFTAKEQLKGHQVNVVKGLKLFEDIFTESQLLKLTDLAYELRAAGQNGDLSGDTFILFNKQIKGNKREMIQLGVPIFGHVKDEQGNDNQTTIEPIPALLSSVVDHLVQWQLIAEHKKPNGCVINFFDEGECSQPFLKPPHLDQPICTLVLAESTMAFGRYLVSDNEGNYKGPLMLPLKNGSLLVMRGNSADMARHVMCASPTKRVSMTFFRVRVNYNNNNQGQSPPTTPQSGAMTLWQPMVPSQYPIPNGYGEMTTPKWGVLRGPMLMLAPIRPVMVSPKRVNSGGTGVFLPWTVGSRRPMKHIPPRAQRGRFLSLTPADEPHVATADQSEQPTIRVVGENTA